MKRVRKENDGSDTVFEPEFATGPYRAEIEVASPNELRALKQDGKLVAVWPASCVKFGTAVRS